jgi:hypothetical protein
MAARISHIEMGAVAVTANDGQFDEAAFSLLPALARKTFAGHPQAAGAATATDSIRGVKTCTERHFDFDEGDCDTRGSLRGG